MLTGRGDFLPEKWRRCAKMITIDEDDHGSRRRSCESTMSMRTGIAPVRKTALTMAEGDHVKRHAAGNH